MEKLNSKIHKTIIPLIGILLAVIFSKLSFDFFQRGLAESENEIIVRSMILLVLSWVFFIGSFYKKIYEKTSPFYLLLTVVLLLLFWSLGAIYYSYGQFFVVVYTLPKVIYFSTVFAFASHLLIIIFYYLRRLVKFLYKKITT